MTVAAAAGLTDVGQRRDHNEDSLLIADPVFAVADGVGGASSGEVASELALQVLAAWSERLRAAGAVSDTAGEAAMANAVDECNLRIHEAQLDDPERAGMATTITAAVVLDSDQGATRLLFGHVGDSRAYRISSTATEQVTDDHSVVGELVRSGQITSTEAADHPQRNVILRALGPDRHVSVDAFVTTLADDEWLLICSDGLTGHVTDDELAPLVLDAADPAAAARALVDLANERGGTDNITVVLVQARSSAQVGALAPAREHAREGGPPSITNPAELSGELSVVSIDRADAHESAETVDLHPGWRGEVGAGRSVSDEPDVAAIEPPVRATARPVDTDPRRPRWRAPLIGALVLLVAFGVTLFAWQQSYFVTERADGTLGVDHGFPFASLHTEYRSDTARVENLAKRDRDAVAAHTLRGREDAERELERLAAKSSTCAEVNADLADDTADAAQADPETRQLPDPDCPAPGS